MNRSKIEWCDHTWNPITGCRHGCGYCYARRMAARFSGDIRLNKMAKDDYTLALAADGGDPIYVLEAPMLNETGNPLHYPFGFEPTFHRYRMDFPEKLKMGKIIFVCAMSDLFGEWVRDEWIKEIFDTCIKNPIHNYLFLTKNPARYFEYILPVEHGNFWYGASITRESEIDRVLALPAGCKTFVSIEPILEDICAKHYKHVFNMLNWVIIGAETGCQKDKITPRKEWIQDIVECCDEVGIPVFMKDSLIPVAGERGMRREFPEELQNAEISPKMKKKLYGTCASCKAYMKKNVMVTLFARYERGKQPKQFGFVCKECFIKLCEEKGWDIPESEEMHGSARWTGRSEIRDENTEKQNGAETKQD